MKYRKKPAVVNAMRFLGPFSWDEMRESDFAKPVFHMRDIEEPTAPPIQYVASYLESTNQIVINTLEGDVFASVGDWIIRGVKGEFYPCKHDIFEATYEPASAPTDLEQAIDHIRFLQSFVPPWVKNVEDGLCATFYGTGTAEGDRVVHRRWQETVAFVEQHEAKSVTTPHPSSESPETGSRMPGAAAGSAQPSHDARSPTTPPAASRPESPDARDRRSAASAPVVAPDRAQNP